MPFFEDHGATVTLDAGTWAAIKQVLQNLHSYGMLDRDDPSSLAMVQKDGAEIYARIRAEVEPGRAHESQMWGVKRCEPGREPCWYTNERHSALRAHSLARTYNNGTDRQSGVFYRAEPIDPEESY